MPNVKTGTRQTIYYVRLGGNISLYGNLEGKHLQIFFNELNMSISSVHNLKKLKNWTVIILVHASK